MHLVKVPVVLDLVNRFGPGVLVTVETVPDIFEKPKHLQRSVVSASESKFGIVNDPTIFHLVDETSQQDMFNCFPKSGKWADRPRIVRPSRWLTWFVDDHHIC